MKTKIIATSFLAVSLLSVLNADVNIDSVGLNLGCMSVSSTQNDKATSLSLDMPQEQMMQAEIYALIGGVFGDASYKPTINYAYAQNSDLSNNMLLFGVNKYFNFDSFNLYLGALVGFGVMDWQYKPASTLNDSQVISPVGALQAGSEYYLSKQWALGLNAKYYLHGYSTEFKGTGVDSQINQENAYSLALGLRYTFAIKRAGYSFSQALYAEEQVMDEEVEVPMEVQEVIQEEVFVAPIVVKEVIKDGDEDGVLDDADLCLTTPKGESVDKYGCALDSDKDSIVDYKDLCPNTPLGYEIDIDGCAKSFTITINFSKDSFDIPADVDAEVNSFVEYMKINPHMQANIVGHSSRTKTSKAKYNENLSLQRADIFKKEIVKRGIANDRMTTDGKGFHEPVADNLTKEGRYQNRRIEIDFIR